MSILPDDFETAQMAAQERLYEIARLIDKDRNQTHQENRERLSRIDDWDLREIELNHAWALHSLRTYDLRKERHRLQGMILNVVS